MPKKNIKNLSTSKDIMDYCLENESLFCILPYKGGFAVIVNGRVKEICVGKNAEEKARTNLIKYLDKK